MAGFAGWAVFRLRRQPMAVWMFVAGSVSLLLFFHVKYAGFARHHGLLYVVLVMSVWLGRTASESAASGQSAGKVKGRAYDTALTALLGLHVVASITAARACPSFNVEDGFTLTNTSSTAASSQP